MSILKIIRGICYSHDSNKDLYRSVHNNTLLRNFYSFNPNDFSPVTKYYEEFLVQVDVVELYSRVDTWSGETMLKEAMAGDGKYDADMSPMDLLLTEETSSDYVDYATNVRERFLAMCFLWGSDQKRFGKLIAELDNNYARKQHQYPTTIKGAYDYLLTYTDPTPTVKKQHNKKFEPRSATSAPEQGTLTLMEETQQDDITFLQDDGVEQIPNTDGILYLGVKCRK